MGAQINRFGISRQPDRPYERMDITAVTGLTAAQRAALKALGAVERVADQSAG